MFLSSIHLFDGHLFYPGSGRADSSTVQPPRSAAGPTAGPASPVEKAAVGGVKKRATTAAVSSAAPMACVPPTAFSLFPAETEEGVGAGAGGGRRTRARILNLPLQRLRRDAGAGGGWTGAAGRKQSKAEREKEQRLVRRERGRERG